MEEREISEFLKFAYAHGKVRDVEEAFEEYPVENEWHKGKLKMFYKIKNRKKRFIKRLEAIFKIVFIKSDNG